MVGSLGLKKERSRMLKAHSVKALLFGHHIHLLFLSPYSLSLTYSSITFFCKNFYKTLKLEQACEIGKKVFKTCCTFDVVKYYKIIVYVKMILLFWMWFAR